MPPMVNSLLPAVTVTAPSLGTVSVVIMALASSCPPSRERLICPIFPSISSIGSLFPITPVLATSTFSADTPSLRAASSDIFMASLSPGSPTEALAQPLFITTALAFFDGNRSCARTTGAALI